MKISNVNFILFKSLKQISKAKATSPILQHKLSAYGNIQNDIFIKQAPSSTKFRIFTHNDSHGNSDSIAGVLNAGKAFNTTKDEDIIPLTLSGGDNVSGADVDKNNFVFNLMQNIEGIEFSAVGNHELDAGADGFCEAIKDKKIQFIASNIVLDKNNPMTKFVKKSIIKEKNGTKFAIVGAMPLDFNSCTKKEAQTGIEILNLEDSISAIQEEVNKLKEQGINKIILLSHCGYETDKQIAQNTDGIDIIVGGHTHSVVDGAILGDNLVYSKSSEPVLISQTGENGKYYGIIDAEFSENGILSKVDNKIVESSTNRKSPIVEYIKEQYLGKSPEVARISTIEPMPKNRRVEFCAWTNMLADSIKSELNTDIALINCANTRKVPQAGILTQRDVQESTPMKNKLLKTTITQKRLVGAIQEASKTTMSNSEGVPGLLQVSGLTYKIDKQGNLLEMYFVENNGTKTEIDINNPSDKIKYSIAYDNFVAKENGEYPLLFPVEKVVEYDFDKDATMLNYLSKLKNKNNLEVIDDKRTEIV